MKRRVWNWLVCMLMMLVVTAGLNAGSLNAEAASLKAKKIVLNSKSESLIVGKSVTLKVAKVSPTTASKKVTWKSSNTKIAKVNKNGKVTAVAAGKATITAVSKTDKKIKATCKIQVYPQGTKAKKLVLNKTSVKMVQGKKLTLKVSKVAPIGANKKVTWTSSKKSVATVNSKGKVTAKKAGTAVIKAISVDNKKVVAKCKVKVYAKTIKLENNGMEYYERKVGDEFTVSAEVTSPVSGASPVTWKSSNSKIAKVTSKGKVTCVAAGTCTLTAVSGSKRIKVKVTVKARTAQDNVELTRGEWIKLLLDKTKKNVSRDLASMTYYYGDTEGHTYGPDIETAQALGILPPADSEGFEDPEQDIPLFRPDEKVTREFAAYTAVKALGFQDDGSTISCSDVASLKYPVQVAIAVKQELIMLQNKAFNPNGIFTYGDKDTLFEGINLLNSATKVSVDKEEESVTFKENVLQETLKKSKTYKVTYKNDGTIVVTLKKTDATDDIKAGKTFVLPANEEHPTGVALKAKKVKTSGKNLVITCTKPEVQEVLSEVSYVGKGTVDPSKVEAAEGVSVSYERGTSGLSQGDYGGSISVPGKLKFTVNKKINSKWKAEGSVSISIPDITCKLKTSAGFKIKELVISSTEKLEFQGGVKYTAAQTKYKLTGGSGNTYELGSNQIELGRLPVKLGTSGLSIDLKFFYCASAGGSATIKYTAEITQGMQYKNGSFRLIKEFENSFDAISISGDAKAGIGMGVVLNAFELMDLVGLDVQGGVGASASFTAHLVDGNVPLDPPLYCSDAALYAYLTMELDPETAFAKLLKKTAHASWSWDIFNKNNSPWKLKLHIENCEVVDECTLGKGAISGMVVDAENQEGLSGARVKIYSGGELLNNVYTDSEGKYSFNGLSAGTYKLKISATGYKTYEDSVTVKKNETTYVEASMMIDREEEDQEAELSGSITDAVNGDRLSGVSFSVREGWSNTTGAVIASGTGNGTYCVTLPVGNYTVTFSKTDYITTSINVTVRESGTYSAHASMSPANITVEGNLRIVLTWGETPRDLDSHLLGTKSTGGDFHIYFSKKNYYENSILTANLDLDDTSSYGPETTTIYTLNENGTYSYYVHDYTNRRSSSSTAMGRSGAKVRVYAGNALIMTYNVPAATGNLWHVFDYDGATKTITNVNHMSYCSNYSGLSRGTEWEAICEQTIWQDVMENQKDGETVETETELVSKIN